MGMVTKNISLDNEHFNKLKPYIEKHNGNFSSAVREIIDKVEKSFIPENFSFIQDPFLNWLLEEVHGRLIPDNILNTMIDPYLICDMSNLSKHVNKKLADLGWKVHVKIDYNVNKIDNKNNIIVSPSSILIDTTGTSYKMNVVTLMISQFIIQNYPDSSPFLIKSVTHLGSHTQAELSSTANKKEGLKSLHTFFGEMEDTTKAIRDRTSFWNHMINRHSSSNYQMVTVHKNYFEDILAGKTPMGETMIEILAKKPIQDIPLGELLPLIKQVYEVSGVVDKVEIRDSNIILFHNYRNKDATEKIKKSLIMLMETSGHLYDGKTAANMLVIEHRPDVGTKINQIVEHLKNSDNKLDQELATFVTYLKNLNNIHDTPMSITLMGRRIGTSLIQEYEKENNIKEWNLENFQKAFTVIDSKIHKDSEWKTEGNSLLYRIRKCTITMEDNNFDAYVCRASREAFKAALDYAFGNKADLEIKKLKAHGDNYCEVVIKLPNKETN
jgi:predicted hydrocarbon binding protein